MKGKIISITKKGQATLPAEYRKKYDLHRKAIVVDTEEGLVVKPLPNPEEEMGSLRDVFEENSEELLRKSRKLDAEREKKLEKIV